MEVLILHRRILTESYTESGRWRLPILEVVVDRGAPQDLQRYAAGQASNRCTAALGLLASPCRET